MSNLGQLLRLAAVSVKCECMHRLSWLQQPGLGRGNQGAQQSTAPAASMLLVLQLAAES